MNSDNFVTISHKHRQGGTETSPESSVSENFQRLGFCLFDDILCEDRSKAAGKSALELLSLYLEMISKQGLKLGTGIKEGFSEIVTRSAQRYDIKIQSTGLLAECAQEISADIRITTFLEGVLGPNPRLVHQDVVVALPGAPDQQWHTDGSHLSTTEHLPCHCLNIFVPLVDLTPSFGPTELRPCSHFLTRDLKRLMLAAFAKKQLHAPTAPLLKAGSALAFDYRVLHRGTQNSSENPRPVLVLTYSKPWFIDVFNFPARSIYASGEECSKDSPAASSSTSCNFEDQTEL